MLESISSYREFIFNIICDMKEIKASEVEIVDLQEKLFENLVLSKLRGCFLSGIGGITSDELEKKLIDTFRESRTIRGKTGFDERVDDVFYFFCEDLRFEYEQDKKRFEGVSRKELDDFLSFISRTALEGLKLSIEKRMKHGEETAKTVPFAKGNDNL